MASKPEIFTSKYWDRPPPSGQGDESGDSIYHAVGRALSGWEMTDQTLAELFICFADARSNLAHLVARRVYGSIESNSGRRNAVLAAAEVYFGTSWNDKATRQPLVDITNAIQWAAKRRDDIAHGIVESFSANERWLGHFLMPPDYNTGRTHAFTLADEDPLNWRKAKYRFVTTDIDQLAAKFYYLQMATRDYLIELRKKPKPSSAGESPPAIYYAGEEVETPK